MNFNVKVYKDLSKNELKKLKQLCVKTTSEKLIAFPDHYIIFASYGISKKPVAMCCVSPFSPELHFKNETLTNVPYLYNYITDLGYRKHKVAFLLMTFMKEEFFKHLYTENLHSKEINLDIIADNEHALNFFKRNEFEYGGEYIKDFGTNNKKIIYNMLTFKFLDNL